MYSNYVLYDLKSMCKDSTTKTYTHARKSYIQNSENMTRQYIGTWAKLRYW